MRKNSGNILLIFLSIAAVVTVILTGYFWWQKNQSPSNSPSVLTWEECLKIPEAKVLQSYQEQCVTPDGRKVTQPLSDSEKQKLRPPAADQTANWKTYISKQYSYLFEYPAGWYLHEYPDGQLIQIDDRPLPESLPQGEGPFYSGYIEVSVLPKAAPREVQVSDPVGTKKCEGSAYCVQLISKFTLDNKNGARLNLTPLNNPTDIVYLYEIDLGTKRIKIVNPSKEKLKILDQILSTFKFLDRNTLNGSSGIYGVATLGPTCPVERPGQTCTAPFVGTIELVRQAGDSAEITSVNTNQDGSFRVSLAPGDYVAERTDTKIFNLSKTKIQVVDNQFTKVNIEFDTGIR